MLDRPVFGEITEADMHDSDQDRDADTEMPAIESDHDSALRSEVDTNVDADSDSDIDHDIVILPIKLEQADPLCIRLNSLIKSGQLPTDRILYKHLNDVSKALINPNHEYSRDVLEFFNTVKYLGGERTAKFIIGPKYHGQGQKGVFHSDNVKLNLGGPSRTVRQKVTSGYTTKSGVIKQWLQCFLELSNDPSGAKPLIDSPNLRVFGVSVQNDSTPLKPSIQFDEQQHINVGLSDRIHIRFVSQNPEPSPEFLKEKVITEVNVSNVTTLDNAVSLPICINYKPKAGKTGDELKRQFLEETDIIQTCLHCLYKAKASENTVTMEAVTACQTVCDSCLNQKKVCLGCSSTQVSHIPAIRACRKCLENGQQCIRVVVLCLTTDCEAGNKSAFE